MTTLHNIRKAAAVLAVATTALTSGSQAAVIYAEAFYSNAAGNDTPANMGWSMYKDTTAVSSSGDQTFAIGVNAGGLASVNSNPNGAVDHGLYGSGLSVFTTKPVLLFTAEFAILSSSYTVTSIDWAQWCRNSTNSTIQAAVLVGGTWYVSNTVYATTSLTPVTKTVNFATDTWQTISFTAGSTLSTASSGTPISLPAGDITAFGWFGKTGVNYQDLRLDNFVINGNAVPEPATWALLAGSLVMVVAFRRRRRA